MRSPLSVFEDSIFSPRFFPAVERNPRTLCACQSVAFMISASVAPTGRPISSRIFAPLLSARGALGSFAPVRLTVFFAALAGFFASAGLAPLAAFLALGASFLGLAPFFEAAFIGATGAPRSATAAAVSGVLASAFVVVMVVLVLSAVDPRMTIHRSGRAERQ